jgi:hypothetical protein
MANMNKDLDRKHWAILTLSGQPHLLHKYPDRLLDGEASANEAIAFKSYEGFIFHSLFL